MRSEHTRNASNLSGPLPAISEDGTEYTFPAPPSTNTTYVPTSTNHTPVSFISRKDRTSHDGLVDSTFSDSSSEAAVIAEKGNSGLRKKSWIARRGGWKKLGLILLLLLLCIIGLIVGLVVGLTNRNNNTTPSWTQTQNTTLNSTYPAGTYSLTPSLLSLSKNCTSNPLTWRCQADDTLYSSSSPNATSPARFDWIIRAYTSSSQSTPIYTVSSTSNPFTLSISNVTLTLVDAGMSSERYTFSMPILNKSVIPAQPLTSANLASTCYFSGTTLSAELYTGTGGGLGNGNGTRGYTAWPGRVSVREVSEGGGGPVCYDNAGGVVGNYSVGVGGGECACNWANFLS